MEPSPLQSMIDVAMEAAGLIGGHIKSVSGELSEEQLIPWSLAFSQLQEAAERLHKAARLDCTDKMLAVGGPLHGLALPASDNFSTPDATAPGRIHTYKRVRLRFSSGFEAGVAAYMG
ncbi:MAG: hypothetical protein GX616_20365 [Planctomycetes bacterium]|nr:hypothetical protein [Planctomycetota bacterium]